MIQVLAQAEAEGAPWVVIAVASIAALPALATLVLGLRTARETSSINRAVNHQPDDAPKLIDWARGTNLAAAEILEKMHIAAVKVEQVAVKAEAARVLAASAVTRGEETLAVARRASRESSRACELSLLTAEQLTELVDATRIATADDARGRRGEIERRREALARIRDERAEDDGAET